MALATRPVEHSGCPRTRRGPVCWRTDLEQLLSLIASILADDGFSDVLHRLAEVTTPLLSISAHAAPFCFADVQLHKVLPNPDSTKKHVRCCFMKFGLFASSVAISMGSVRRI